MKQAGLEHPIAVDPGFAMWKKLKHNSWPAYYLVDRQGRLRSRWLGPLKSEQADGDKLIRQRIEELLKER